MENARLFTPLVENKFWSRLQEANRQHVTAQQQYLHLLKDLENQGVAFKDIRNYMLNEAKRAGLYQKVNGEYPSKNELKRRNEAWFVALKNFGAWVNRNYDGRYDKVITSEDRKNAQAKRKAEKSEKKTSVITRSEEGGEVRTDVVETTTDMDAPVEESLTPQQIEAILFNNLDILGEYAEDKGALVEFNALMVAIGKPEAKIVAAAQQ
jgi:hypothetical protein